MRVRPYHSQKTWRKTLHAFVCVAVVLSNLFSLLALTPQAVQAGNRLRGQLFDFANEKG